MKLTKATQNGLHLWVVEYTTTGGGKIRTMYHAEVDLTDAEQRARVARELWEMRSDLRAFAELPPPA